MTGPDARACVSGRSAGPATGRTGPRAKKIHNLDNRAVKGF